MHAHERGIEIRVVVVEVAQSEQDFLGRLVEVAQVLVPARHAGLRLGTARPKRHAGDQVEVDRLALFQNRFFLLGRVAGPALLRFLNILAAPAAFGLFGILRLLFIVEE